MNVTSDTYTVPAPAVRGRSAAALVDFGCLTVRLLRALWKMPTFLVIGLVQPVVWLLLFGQLFKSVVELPGFAKGDGGFVGFLTPGVVMMTVLFASSWTGTTFLDDIKHGVMDWLLTSPVSRAAIVCAALASQAVQAAAQSIVIVLIALVAGARFPGGVLGVVIAVIAAVLLTVIFSGLSSTIALLSRRQSTLIAISQFTTLPLMFLSSAIIDLTVAPAWVQEVARFNPVEWAVSAARAAMQGWSWSTVWIGLGLLAAAAFVMTVLTTRAFKSYQRSR